MNTKRWTLGVVLAVAVGLWGLMEADASPFSSTVLSDDLGNTVNGKAPTPTNRIEAGNVNNGQGNNGHGNNEDGVDSSNPGQGHGGPNGADDASCDGTGDCVDDEMGGGSDTSSGSKGKGKKK